MIGKKLFDYSVYHKYFSPEAMWNKISAVARKAGMELIYAVLLLYYVAIRIHLKLINSGYMA